LPVSTLFNPNGRMEFIEDLQSKVVKGYEKLTGSDLGYKSALNSSKTVNKIEGKGFAEE
jgi:hypothetical protein